jgi:hypothetical protein
MNAPIGENFIRDFVDLYAGSEVPQIYAVWTALCGVSACLGRRVSLRVGMLTYYPNIMVVLVGASGVKKSTPINGLRKRIFCLPQELRPNIIATSVTPAHFVEAMIRKTNQFSMFSETCEGYGLISELGNFLSRGAYDTGLAELLIDLYDCEPYTKGTRSHGIEHVPDPCFGLLSGTTPNWIRESIPQGAVGGGLTSRFIFVYVEGRGRPVADPPFTPAHQAAMERIDRQLARLCMVPAGTEMVLSPEAYVLYVHEYDRWHMYSEYWDNPSLSGYAQRRNGHLLKVAMCLAMSKGSLVIEEYHFDGALSVMLKAETMMPMIMNRITSSVDGSNQEWIMGIITRESAGGKSISRTRLMSLVVHKISSRELTEILQNLLLAGMIDTPSNNGVDFFYKPKGK